jgi:dihydrofolate reductase
MATQVASIPTVVRQLRQVVGGVSMAQQLLDAGLVDALHVDIMPVFLGTGLRSFENSSQERVRLEKTSV